MKKPEEVGCFYVDTFAMFYTVMHEMIHRLIYIYIHDRKKSTKSRFWS